MIMSNWENAITIVVLAALSGIYIYLLVSPSQPHLPDHVRNFVIPPDTNAAFESFLKDFKDGGYSSKWSEFFYYDKYSNESKAWGGKARDDDFFLEENYAEYYGQNGKEEKESVPNVPSSRYQCHEGWVTIRSEMNYKYLWMHSDEKLWMGASATIDTPLHRKAFQVLPVHSNCSDGGWVRLREADSQQFIMMVPPTGDYAIDEWVVKFGTENADEADKDEKYHFLMEEDGYLMNKGSMAFINVMPEAQYSIRGHTGGWDRSKAASREYGAMVRIQFVNDSLVNQAIQREVDEQKDAKDQDDKLIKLIKKFPQSTEKRVISFGLYGAKDKYTMGAVANAELAKTYFPGWTCRFYVTSDVPEEIVSKLKSLGSEIESIPSGMGYSSGMFWRFMVADDASVDRFIVRDVDSRLNARDRVAVEEWINLKYPIHVLRDHVNHCIVMNGGMWGGVKGALPYMKDRIMSWSSRDEYMADLHFLEQKIWPDIKSKQVAHDSYCCDRFPNTKPFPTRRALTYQHVGQVFDSNGNARLGDIDGFIRGVPIPSSCRKDPEWIYG